MRSEIRVGEINCTENGEMEEGKAKRNQRFLPWKVRETEKALTGNEALSPVKIEHVAIGKATATTTQSMRSRIPSAISEEIN